MGSAGALGGSPERIRKGNCIPDFFGFVSSATKAKRSLGI
jgi:hypothetical protein